MSLVLPTVVITGLVPVIRASYDTDIGPGGPPWIAGSSPAMTINNGMVAMIRCLWPCPNLNRTAVVCLHRMRSRRLDMGAPGSEGCSS